ncbi:MAG: alpha/beta fold hydrolase [Bacteroidota bacterium]
MVKKKHWIKRVLKIVGILFTIIFIVFIVTIYQFSKPKSDEYIHNKFKNTSFQPTITFSNFEGYKVRLITMQKAIDTTLPTLIFVHGSPGSSMDFKEYLTDSLLNKKTNIITYDRIGYSIKKHEKALNNINKEVSVLHNVIGDLPINKVILIGYSYGGTIVMAASKNYRSKIVLAPSVKGEFEPLYWVLNFYKWNLTRPLIPRIFQNAALEKITHITELPTFGNKWTNSFSPVISIHGDSDRIVPYKNSLYLKEIFNEKQFSLKAIDKGTHALVWTHFDLIKNEILKKIEK